MSGPKPTRTQGDLAEMLETLLDKGVVINADIAVTVGETDLLGVHVRAAIASFETAAAYGLEFPSGTDMERVEAAAGVDPDPVDTSPLSVRPLDDEEHGDAEVEVVPDDATGDAGETAREGAAPDPDAGED